MTRLIVLSIVLFTTTFSFSQELDKIYLKDKTVLSGIILKVGEKNIEIDPEGDKPFLIVKRSEADVIIYADNTVVDLADSKTKRPQKEPIENLSPIVNGFRTDGYYINKQGIQYRFKKKEILMGSMVNSSKQILFVGFRVNPKKESTSKYDYTEIQVAVFIERKGKLKKTLKQELNPTWEEFHEKYLSKDKIDRSFTENDLKKKEDEIIAIQMNYEKDPFTFINYKDGITIMAGNFFGVTEGVPRADFLICRSPLRYKHPRNGQWEGENEYDPKATFSEENNNKFWEVHKDIELKFFPDN